MTYAISLILLLANFLLERKKIPFFIFSVFIWILSGWCFSNADTMVYELRYSYDVTVTQEPLFMAIIYLCRLLGVEFAQYRIIYTGLFLAVLVWAIYKYSENYNFVIILYFLFPFWYDAVQLRQFGGNALVILGIARFLSQMQRNSNVRKRDTYELFFILVAAVCVHIAEIYYFLLFLAIFCNVYIVILIMVVICIIVYIMLTPDIILSLTSILHVPGKGYSLLAIMNRVSGNQIKRYLIFYLFGLCGALVLIVLHDKLKKDKLSMEDKKVSQFLVKCHVISMMVIPLILRGAIDFVRMQYPLIILTYIYVSSMSAFGYGTSSQHFILRKNNLIYSLIVFAYVFLLLYFWILSNQNIDTVFHSIMENNLIFRG